MLQVQIGIASMMQFQCVPTKYVLKLNKHFFLKYTLNKYHVHWLSSFKYVKLPISIKIPVTIWQIVYIYMAAFDFTNYAFTRLVIACYCRAIQE